MSDTPSNTLRVILRNVVLSYPSLFRAVTGPSGEGKPKYKATIVITPGPDFADNMRKLKAAAVAAGNKKFGAEKFSTLLRTKKGTLTLHDDPEEVREAGYPEGSVFFAARSETRPQLASRYADPATGKVRLITEESQQPGHPDELYAGCVVNVSVVAFGYEFEGKRGVSFALGNLQKVSDGKRLDNRRSADAEFEADLSEEPASLTDLGIE